jgi:hypothetical protein
MFKTIFGPHARTGGREYAEESSNDRHIGRKIYVRGGQRVARQKSLLSFSLIHVGMSERQGNLPASISLGPSEPSSHSGRSCCQPAELPVQPHLLEGHTMSAITRRHALGAAAGLAAACTAHGPARAAGPQAHDLPGAFDEIYKGRRIQGAPTHSRGHDNHHMGYAVHIDGQELHIMRNADSTWISIINHYQPQPTTGDLARAAVVELQGAALVSLTIA